MVEELHTPFKLRKSFGSRCEEASCAKSEFPDKIPIVVERYHLEKKLPYIDITKFLVPHSLTMIQLSALVKSRMSSVELSQPIFFHTENGTSLKRTRRTMGDIYEREQDDDGFLYVTYTSQEKFNWTLGVTRFFIRMAKFSPRLDYSKNIGTKSEPRNSYRFILIKSVY